MKPTVISNASSNAGSDGSAAPPGGAPSSTNGVNIPINHEFQQYAHPHPQYPGAGSGGIDASVGTAYGSPNSFGRQQHHQQQQPYAPHPHAQQQAPSHFQTFGFEPDMDMDMGMFPRTRLSSRMHDPFAGLGGKRTSKHEPHSMATDDFSRYFDDAADFGFPHFGSMRARQHPTQDDDDFFTRLPAEFRQYIPETFGHRRAGPSSMPQQTQKPPQGGPYYQNYVPTGSTPPSSAGVPQSPSKKLCDAAIQTEDRSEVDHAAPMQGDHLNQHGLRNTVDMGVKSAAENEAHGPRSHSAPPNEQLQQQQQQQAPINGQQRPTPPPQGGWPQYGNQPTSQHAAYTGPQHQPPQFQKAYYPPQQQAHPQQKQQTPPPPQTPGGSYVRSIPIFVEGRSEPIINAHKEIPQQSATGGKAAPSFPVPPQQQQQQQQQQHPQQHQQAPHPQSNVHQQHRPTPLNTQQHPPQEQSGGVPPQTPHTLNSINKIQDIQRDVLDLMSKVEKFTGTRKDKEYVYLDEMLTRNLLKLDTIDTNGKDSIRLARKEAIKCIQASINVLEAKAEENARNAAAASADSDSGVATKSQSGSASSIGAADAPDQQSSSETKDQNTSEKAVEAATPAPTPSQAGEAGKQQEAIPLPPPDSETSATAKNTTDAATAAAGAEAQSAEGASGVTEATSSESK